VRKWTGRILTAVSLVLLIGTAGMWALGQWAYTEVRGVVWVGAADPVKVTWLRVEASRGSLWVILSTSTIAFPDADGPGRFRADLSARGKFECSTSAPESFHWDRWFSSVSPAAGRLGFNWQSVPFQAWASTDEYVDLADHVYRETGFSGTALALPWWFLTLC
jgi:hypothetical protein